MIETINPQVINAQTGETKIVYFEVGQRVTDYTNKTVSFSLGLGHKVVENGIDIMVPIGDINVISYKMETFLELFGHLTQTQFEDQKDTLMIERIDFANSYVPTGEEDYPIIKFWNLTIADLQIVV